MLIFFSLTIMYIGGILGFFFFNSLWVLVKPFLSYILFYFILFYLFLAVLGLRCCTQVFSSCSERGLLFVGVRGLLIAVASLVVEHRFQVHQPQQLWLTGSIVVAHGLQSSGSVVVAHGVSCSAACGIFLDQGSNPCPQRWQADS